MPEVQFQRFDKRGSLVECFTKDVRDNHEYLEIIEPLDQIARDEGGKTRTVAPGAPLAVGGAHSAELPEAELLWTG